MDRSGRRAGTGRAQAGSVGTALVFSMMIVSAVLVLIFGAVAINDAQNTLAEQRAEKAMTQFDSMAALVALGNTDIQQASFDGQRAGSVGVRNGSGRLLVTVEDQTSGTSTTVVNESLGAMTTEVNGNTLAYQGGGVWKTSDHNGSVMVSPPEFHFRNGTLTLPVVNVSGSASLDRTASIRHVETSRTYPDVSTNDTNPLTNHVVTVSVKSDYYQGWGRYFEDRTDGEVEYDHDRKMANLTLVSPISQRKVTDAAASLSASGTFVILGSTHGDCNSDDYTDSYNSSGTTDDYCDQYPSSTGNNGDLLYGKSVDISSGSGSDEIRGDVDSGGDVTVGPGGGKPFVFGHINYTDSCNPNESECLGRITDPTASVQEINGLKTVPSVEWYVESTTDTVADSNDNANPQINSNELDFSSVTTRTLDSGQYYLERIDMDADEELELDTTGGDVTLVVEEYVDLGGSGSDGATIRVVGDGIVRMYVNGTGTVGADKHLRMGKNAAILNAGDDAPQFRLYGKRDFNATLDGGGSNLAKFVGVIYAPPGDYGTGSVELTGGEIYGGVLTGTTTLDDGSIHYDEALRNRNIISRNAKVLKITYIHVSINRIHVS